MGERRRRGLTGTERGELWRRWKQGQSLSDIGRALNKAPASVHGFLSTSGGIAPVARRRSDRVLTAEEREEISRQLCAGSSMRSIATCLGKAPSTISREITRNGGRKRYRAADADSRAWTEARRPKTCKLGGHRRLRRTVAEKLRLDWSPEQIAGWLRVAFPNDVAMHVSHETIYRSLFVQARGVLKRELLRHLRTRRVMRRGRTASTAGQSRGQIVDAVSIRERPAEVEDRAIPGHWEGDLITGSKNSHIATLVERTTRFTKLVKVEGKDTASVVAALSRQIRTLPRDLRRTLTWDRGTEMAQHKRFSIATNVKVYFCDPKSPWQRGTNENTNGLLRQYFPNETDLSGYIQRDLDEIARRLNQRPRKTLGFISPEEKLQRMLP
jgi:IS30 family transposase